jgi:peptide/nickel transport system permease protein
MSPVRALAWVTLAALTAFAGLAPWTLPDPHAQDLSRTLRSPDLLYWLGTDTLGRNVMARLAEAMRTSLSLALVSATAAALIGCSLGIWAAWWRDWRSQAVQGVSDGVMAMPALLWVLLLSALAPGEKWPLYLGLICTAWVEFFRSARASAAVILSSPQVQSSRLLGFGPGYVVRHHIGPELWPRMLTLCAFAVCNGVLAVAAMGFVGIGLRPPQAELGLLMTEALPHFDSDARLLFAPVLVLLAFVLSLHTLAVRPDETSP